MYIKIAGHKSKWNRWG